MEKKAVGRNGVGLGTVVFVVFLILKLVGVIDWHWVWVFSPLWIPLATGVAVVLLYIVSSAVLKLIDSNK